MKIAVTYENGQVFQHFGHTKQFKIYDIQEGVIKGSSILDTDGEGHGALAGFLKTEKVDALICGGIGDGAKNALNEAGITLYGGVSGGTDKAVQDLLAGALVFNPDIKCSHHEEHHHSGGEGHHRHNN